MPYHDDMDEESDGCAPVTIIAGIVLGLTAGVVGLAILFYLIQNA